MFRVNSSGDDELVVARPLFIKLLIEDGVDRQMGVTRHGGGVDAGEGVVRVAGGKAKTLCRL